MWKPFMVEFTGTPEAGKTTSIRNVANKLLNEGYTVAILEESAERLPEEIPKGTWDANLWMHYQTQAGILRATYLEANVVLIDRGLIDSNFYGRKFLWENVCSEEQYQNFRKQFMYELLPDFLVALVVQPQIAIQRRGGAGRLVNEEYVRAYNKLFMRYYDEIECQKALIDTAELDVYQMNEAIFQTIKSRLP